jgi:hypothetical protein
MSKSLTLDAAQVKRAIAAIESGARIADLCKRFHTSDDTLYKLCGTLRPKEKVYLSPESERERWRKKRKRARAKAASA